ncbi:MAG: sulfate ABC transporter substrate-binding protein [Nitrosospira sp.]|nr:sulfate ABC transporter substrate-binding protein [Nitrosospira sp.]
MRSYRFRLVFAVFVILIGLGAAVGALHNISEINDSDPTQRMYEDLNRAFVRHWLARTGVEVKVRQAQSITGVPVRAVVDGLDVTTLALLYDPGAMENSSRFTLPDWQKSLPHNTPFTSTVVFLVRKGNPKNLTDWGDLARPGVNVVTPDPRTSYGARWNYMAAWGYAFKQFGGNEAKAMEFVQKLFANVSTLRRETHDSRMDFVERGTGDVLLVWEYEAHQIAGDRGGGKFELVTPSISILAEPPLSVVNGLDDRTGSREVARAYMDYLYTTRSQDIAGKHYYRPRDEKIAAKYAAQFPPLDLFTIDDIFGGWKEAQNRHFADGGIFDHIPSNGNI